MPSGQPGNYTTLTDVTERIEQWPLASLQPYAKNAKADRVDQVAKIAASMAECWLQRNWG